MTKNQPGAKEKIQLQITGSKVEQLQSEILATLYDIAGCPWTGSVEYKLFSLQIMVICIGKHLVWN